MNTKKIIIGLKSFKRFKAIRQLQNIYLKRKFIQELIAEGSDRFEKENNPQGSLKDFVTCAKQFCTSYDEYRYHFELWNKSDDERKEFMSQVSLRLLYNTLLSPEVETLFWNKETFLKKYSHFIHRKWISGASPKEKIAEFIAKHDCIVKPLMSACGNGIFKLKAGCDIPWDSMPRASFLIEECIYNEPQTKCFHPNSLNTVRIVTVKSKNGDVNVLGSFIRFGTGGHVVDNGGNDGILAQVDVVSGLIVTDAFDKTGNSYSHHPDSGLEIKGFKIPGFNKMVETCTKAHLVEPKVSIVGWDVVLRDNGLLEIIEGNHRPDAYGLQMPLKKGYRTRLNKLLN